MVGLVWGGGKSGKSKEATPVTLACEDDQQLEANKVILAATSPFLDDMLSGSKQTHSLIYLGGFH